MTALTNTREQVVQAPGETGHALAPALGRVILAAVAGKIKIVLKF